ncbi:hypothetical protein ENUP19_0304G0045 [Entamoeba nuttalli]|uniref:Adenine DNA glycosylase n=2 Tax=Entamoeba nuttalli TaxID=412467 RepID=K2H1Z5_ENTNP|nr:A/G-specific adenine glycosylase, putative [Entamoeba nuttalli P19]EKE40297.1 A/G-specific adenine glycosylase, putative [Entamoeba nuttalli P19]|eukprot:XP_008857367.1 A/G-specific adenine glycosylase, putative [Entamoeba nuttalli P19]
MKRRWEQLIENEEKRQNKLNNTKKKIEGVKSNKQQITIEVDPLKIKQMHEKILKFYEKEGRKLPWRETTDKYKILVSEVMLQQTQVTRVIEKYKSWLIRFPTIQDLAKANLADVLEEWNGLGFNSRGKRLRDLAIEVCERYNGIIPSSVDKLLNLPGIGPYTANAVLIFSENQDIATVDANIRRILIHELSLDEKTPENILFAYANKCLPLGRSRDWHNALMDYGALVATGKKTGITAKSKQSKFEGSRRSYRAELLRRIRKNNGSLSIENCEEVIKGTKYTLEEIIEGLEKDGIVHKEGDFIILNK